MMMIITKANDAWINGREDADTNYKKSTGDNATKTGLIAHIINTKYEVHRSKILYVHLHYTMVPITNTQ